jgi:hypothetical protein
MNYPDQQLETLKDIKNMMEKSSRFISLSGLSGIAAGICALAGAWFAHGIIHRSSGSTTIRMNNYETPIPFADIKAYMGTSLFRIAILTFVAAFILAFLFTYLRSKKNHTPIWGSTSKRLMINVAIPMLAGGVYLLKLMENGTFGLIAPGCLIFYGLALINASKFTLNEIKYLGYAQIILGIINLWFIGYGLYFWATGFGLLHIFYGAMMWWKYERN